MTPSVVVIVTMATLFAIVVAMGLLVGWLDRRSAVRDAQADIRRRGRCS